MRDGSASTRIRIGAGGRVRIAAAGVRVVIDITLSDLTIVIGDGPTIEVRANRTASRKRLKGSRSLAAPTFVSPEMEMAAVNAFLGGADTVRLGRSLAEVYGAMDAVRRQHDDDDEGDAGLK